VTKPDDEGPLLDVLPVPEGLNGWVRGSLVGLALGLLAVFGAALVINPYEADGTPRRLSTHTQLGLQPCKFYELTGKPCPSCGMTTSFALLVRGDLANSLRANWVGTGSAILCLALIPWALASAWCGRTLFIRSMERALITTLLAFLALMFLRWVLVIWVFPSALTK
jgi:hypothetical protein